jgi:hypothetical protein
MFVLDGFLYLIVTRHKLTVHPPPLPIAPAPLSNSLNGLLFHQMGSIVPAGCQNNKGAKIK